MEADAHISDREKLLVILGPTASGKTWLSVELAKELSTEIISGDSMLVYKGFDIGTAKPSKAEMQGIPHHMIDILRPDADFNLNDFMGQVKHHITALNEQHKIPILAGGTGLYIQSLLEGYELNSQGTDKDFRRAMEALAKVRGKEYVHGLLKEADPVTAAEIHPGNLQRVIRALEVSRLGGERLSRRKSGRLIYDVYVVGLKWQRNLLYNRINQRVIQMQQQGLAEEVQGLLDSGVSAECQAMRGIGYKELLPALQENTSEAMAAAISKIQQNSRHFAKRQLTWYRRMPYIHWYQPELYPDLQRLKRSILWDIHRWLGNADR